MAEKKVETHFQKKRFFIIIKIVKRFKMSSGTNFTNHYLCDSSKKLDSFTIKYILFKRSSLLENLIGEIEFRRSTYDHGGAHSSQIVAEDVDVNDVTKFRPTSKFGITPFTSGPSDVTDSQETERRWVL